MNSRELILRALYRIENEGAYSSKALSDALRASESIDRAFITEVFYGVLKNLIMLDYIIAQFSSVKLKKMSVWIKNILRTGVYQIYFMERVPDSAACSESVKLAKKYSHKAGSGFVNGVMRNISRNKENIKFPERNDDIVKYFSVKYSYPEWMTEKLINQFGEIECEKIFEEDNRPHPVMLRINTLKVSAEELISRLLSENGIKAHRDAEAEDCLVADGGIDINSIQAYKEGLFSLHNKSSMLAVQTLEPQSGDFVIDVCAAPGGKSSYIAELMKNKGRVLAFDIHAHKVELIKKSAKRLGIDIIEARVHNSEACDTELLGKADRVLVDAPCSGLGVIHRKPDIKFSRKPEDIKSLSETQLKILNASAGYLKHGGILVYSTCTILDDENGNVVRKFLKENSGFEIEEEKLLLTYKTGGSGFYICKMKRI